MTLDKVRVGIFTDDDGHQLEIVNTSTKKTRTYRADFVSDKPNAFIWYRMDLKPTTRTHEIVELPDRADDLAVFDTWVDEELENLAQGVM